MINQKLLSEIKISEITPDKYYIFSYDEKFMEENEMSGYKAVHEIIDCIRANFPDIKFVIGPDYKLNIKEVLDLEGIKNLKIVIDDWLKEAEKSETI